MFAQSVTAINVGNFVYVNRDSVIHQFERDRIQTTSITWMHAILNRHLSNTISSVQSVQSSPILSKWSTHIFLAKKQSKWHVASICRGSLLFLFICVVELAFLQHMFGVRIQDNMTVSIHFTDSTNSLFAINSRDISSPKMLQC